MVSHRQRLCGRISLSLCGFLSVLLFFLPGGCTKDVPVQSVTLSPPALQIPKGGSGKVSVVVSPSNATYSTPNWELGSPGVVSYKSSRLEATVTAVKPGTTTLKCTLDGKSATCQIVVTSPAQSISLDIASKTIKEKESFKITATVNPSDCTDAISWSSSDERVAKVDGNGNVTGISEGSADIIAKAGDKTASCSVTVTKPVIPITGVSLSPAELNLEKGNSAGVVVVPTPADATITKAEWGISNSSVISLEPSSLKEAKVSALAPGSATITYTVDGHSATCTVKVTAPAKSVTLDVTSKTIRQGESLKLTATVNPTDSTDPLSWSSSDYSVASVDGKGNVKGVGQGTATITAKAGDKSATCSVTVSNDTTGGHEGTGGEEWN